MPPAEVYCEVLKQAGYGRPLWVPELEVEVGDVGFIESGTSLSHSPSATSSIGVLLTATGQFIRVFNCMEGADPRLNPHGVPNGSDFTPLRLRTRQPPIQAFIASPSTIKRGSIRQMENKVSVAAQG